MKLLNTIGESPILPSAIKIMSIMHGKNIVTISQEILLYHSFVR